MTGLLLPLVELLYKKSKQTITFSLVIELQIVIAIFATLFCTIGMLAANDFQVIQREAEAYELRKIKYYVVLVASAIIWQVSFVGTVGVIFCSTSLLTAVFLPATEILAVIFFHESFKAEKGIALFPLALGFHLLLLHGIQRKKHGKEVQVTVRASLFLLSAK
uniref:Pup3-like-1 n=2 Tax=Papaver somniferum TaxID=3469 RepID=A0A5B7LJP0_PAPSO|nr:pup3-like-1 [Papaver somniferum]